MIRKDFIKNIITCISLDTPAQSLAPYYNYLKIEKTNELINKLDWRKNIPTIVEKISRNELCNCGSGKKFKKCCLK